jgi:hypothetical protein
MTFFSSGAQAVNIDTGNSDVELRWDNSVRYNAGVRTGGVNNAFYKSSGYDETEGRFKRGDVVTNRVDLVSELDMTYKGKYGFRVSGAAWYDDAYSATSVRNPALANSGNYANNHYNSYADRYIHGPSGEILDAFVFGAFELGGTTLNVKAGQHNVYWGESLYSVGNSIAYSMGAVDTIKSATSPGAEAKELFLPRKQLSGQWQLSNEVSLGAQYAFGWKPFRLVPGGTYFASGDATRADFAAPGIANGPDIEPNQRGDFGVNVRWSPSFFPGTAGFYYRRFDEKLPWGITQLGATPTVRLAFARDTELYGFSLTTNVSTVSVGAELSYRKNTALNPISYTVIPANGTSATYDEAEGPRGNTMHALLNGVYLLPRTALWDGGTLQAELNYSRLLSVTKHAERFNGEGYACPAGRDRSDGCSTKDAIGVNVGFTPSWPQAIAGWDLSMPTSLAYQIKGNGPALGGGNEGALSWSIGVTGTLYSKYEFSLKYADTQAQYKVNPATGVVTTTNGTAVQNDHGWVFFTFKTTF